jgi:IS30 family transposase
MRLSPEQMIAVLGALTALVVAVGSLYRQVRQTHDLVNSRMTELLDATKAASHAEGKLAVLEPPTSDPTRPGA